MNRTILVLTLIGAGVASAEDLQPAEFQKQLAAQHGLLLDVRTPSEVAEAMVAGASVIDFRGPKFEQKLSLIARDRPVFVYCRSGGRSGQAAELMAKMGFSKIFNLSGGIQAWKAAGLPVEKSGAAPVASGDAMTPEAFDALLKTNKRLLVDFQTPWCTPCQKMVPVVDAVAGALQGVKVMKVDLDQSEALSTREKVQGVPVFVLYVDGKERARLTGEQSKEALLALAKK